MVSVQFEYKGRRYSGNVVSSTDMQPHYYWFNVADPELVSIVGKTIPFRLKDGQLVPDLMHTKQEDLIGTVKQVLEEVIIKKHNNGNSSQARP